MSSGQGGDSPDRKSGKMPSSKGGKSDKAKGDSPSKSRSSSASRHGHPGASSSAGASSSHDLPKSVRNAPPELRTAIRRRQNNESAKRSREKKREEQAEMQKKFVENGKRIEKLEKQVDDLTDYLSKKKGSKKNGSDRHPEDPGSSSGIYGDPF